MIIVCTHKSPDVLKQCLSSIRKFSKEFHRILCVETSDSQVSKEIADKYDAFFENTTLKYEIGAFNFATDLYPGEPEYFLFQDSVEIVAENWEVILRVPSQGIKMVAPASYRLIDDPCPGCGEDVFYDLYGKSWPLHNAHAVGNNNFYVPQAGLRMLKQFGINKLTAHCKNDTFATERVLGAIAHYTCGFDSASSLVGEWVWEGTQYRKDTGFTKYIYKHTLMRQ